MTKPKKCHKKWGALAPAECHVTLCPYWRTAPHGCGDVNRQEVRDAAGVVVDVWRCTFCGYARKPEPPQPPEAPCQTA